MALPNYPITEVLSPTTEVVDRGKKFFYYQECPTIQEYLLVDSQSARIEVYHREDDGWKLHTYVPGSTVKLSTLSIQFPADAVYRGMKLTEIRKSKNILK